MARRRRQRLGRRSQRSSGVLLLLILGIVGVASLLGSGLARALHPPEIATPQRLSVDFLAPEAVGDEFAGRTALEKDLLTQGRSPKSISLNPDLPPPDAEGTVDPVVPSYWLGRDLYREACGTCHVAIPPAVLPIQTWQRLLVSEQHYGKVIQPPTRGTVSIIWNYVKDYSRPLRESDPIPYRLDKSRFFRTLHPGVEFPEAVRVNQCATCHVRAEFFNFRLYNDAQQPRTPGIGIFPIPDS